MVEMTPAQIRGQLLNAQELAKMRVAFVVVPVLSQDELNELATRGADNLQKIADEAENVQR